jgi:hypothetical protein
VCTTARTDSTETRNDFIIKKKYLKIFFLPDNPILTAQRTPSESDNPLSNTPFEEPFKEYDLVTQLDCMSLSPTFVHF